MESPELSGANIYNVTIKGVREGQDIDQVLKTLSTLFKASPETLRPLLLSKNLVAKKSVDFQTAEKYQKAIANAGCVVEIESDLELDNIDYLIEDPSKSINATPNVNSNEECKSKHCSRCSHENISNAKFCENCGKRFVSGNVCELCGADNPPASRLCVECGNSLNIKFNPNQTDHSIVKQQNFVNRESNHKVNNI